MQDVLDKGAAVLSRGLTAATGQDVRLQAPNFQVDDLPDNAKRECILFYYHECEALAQQIASGNSHIRLGSIRWAYACGACTAVGAVMSCTLMKSCACSNFADGFPNLFVSDAHKIRNRHVAFLANFQNPATIFEQLSVIYQLPRMFVGSFTLVLPYFPTGTAERVRTTWYACTLAASRAALQQGSMCPSCTLCQAKRLCMGNTAIDASHRLLIACGKPVMAMHCNP